MLYCNFGIFNEISEVDLSDKTLRFENLQCHRIRVKTSFPEY